MSGKEHPNQGNTNRGMAPREWLDAYFDGELDRAGKGRLHEALRQDPVLAEEFSRTSEAVSLLRQSAASTALDLDLTGRVLASYEARRGFLSRRGRRFVLAGRTTVALAALAMAAGVVAWVRLTPPALRLSESQRPLGVLIDRGAADAATMHVVPQQIQQELADSVDPSKIDPRKVERTIVFNLQPEGPGAFSAFGIVPERASESARAASLPLLASITPRGHDGTAGEHAPLRQGGTSAASMVRAAEDTPAVRHQGGWWSRPDETANGPHRVRLFGLSGVGGWLLLPQDGTHADPVRE